MSVRIQGKFVLATALVLAFQVCWADADGALSVGTSINYSSGKYGATTATDITSVPLNLAYDKGPWTLKLSVPYVRITGPDNVVAGIGKRATTTTAIRTASGLGDIVSSATYNFFNDAASHTGADVTAKVKFGTGDAAKGLGTGANDFSALLDVYKKINEITLFAGVAYTVMGSTDAIALKNVFGLTAGSTFKVDDRSTVGLSYDYRQKTTPTSTAQSEATAFYSHKFGQAWKTQAYLLKGFSDGSPDYGGGVAVGYTF